MTTVDIDPWDLRHLLLSLDGPLRLGRDGDDLEAVARRAVAALSGLPPQPPLVVEPAWTVPLWVEGRALWIMEANGWILAPEGPGGPCLLVDVPPAPEALLARIHALALRPVAVVLTHGHVDHTGGAGAVVAALGGRVPVLVHPGDRNMVLDPAAASVVARVAADVRPPPARAVEPLADGTVLRVGRATVQAVHTPGHTPGSTCLVVEGGARPLLFSGDALFASGTGRCDLPGGSRAEAEASLQAVVAPLAGGTVVLPGHGGVTTVAQERAGQLAPPPLAA